MSALVRARHPGDDYFDRAAMFGRLIVAADLVAYSLCTSSVYMHVSCMHTKTISL